MSWKEKRIVTILGSIVVILLVAALLVYSSHYRAQQQEEAAAAAENQAQEAEVAKTKDTRVVSDLRWNTGSTNLHFTLDEDELWVWADQPDFPLQQEPIRAVVDLVEESRTAPTCAEPKEGDAAFSNRTVTVSTGKGEEYRLCLAKTAGADGKYYARRADDTYCLVPGDLVKKLNIPIYDLCKLPKLPDLSNPESISIRTPRTPKDTILFTRGPGESWLQGDRDITDNALFQGLLTDLQNLAYDKCVDYVPSDRAVEICGLNPPTAVLTIRRTDGELVTFRIGDRLADKSGRYVQRGSEDPIYLFESKRLDPLMRIASKGLN